MKNTVKTTSYPIKQLPNGDVLHLRTHTVTGSSPGSHVHIQASVHGAEHQGNVVIYELLQYFQSHDFRGSVTFVPAANPAAINLKIGTSTYGRFNPMTGHNWNRSFHDVTAMPADWTDLDYDKFVADHLQSNDAAIASSFKVRLQAAFERCETFLFQRGPDENGRLHWLLQKVAASADIVLDLHTGPVACRYLFSPEYAKNSARWLDADVTLLIPHDFAGAMDEACFVPWVKLQDAFQKAGRDWKPPFESFTVELGSEEQISFSDAKTDAQRILNYLMHKGLIEGTAELPARNRFAAYLRHYKTYTSPYGGLVEFLQPPGSRVTKGDAIAQFLLPGNITGSQSVVTYKAPIDLILVTHHPSSAISQGAELFYALEEFFPF